jgi:predicted dehydrogenase
VLQDQEMEQGIYLNAENETGYIRDKNVFRDGIDIEDTASVLVRYRDGTLLNYSLNAYSPYEGYRVTFTGDRGRIEYREMHGAHLIGNGQNDVAPAGSDERELRVYPHFKPPYEVKIQKLEGAHGGGDPLLQEQIFSRSPPADPLGRSAGHEQGAASILIGIAANQSIATGQPVAISQLVPLAPEAVHLSQLK